MTDADLNKLEALAKAATQGEWRAWITRRRQPEIYTDGGSSEQNDKIASGVLRKADAAFIEAAQPATILDLIASARRDAEEIERLRGVLARYGDEPENDTWWKTVIGETHQPSGDGISVKHLHPLTVKPFYEQHKGTAIADIIAGLIFEAAITRNRERFLVDYANERAIAAEARAAHTGEG